MLRQADTEESVNIILVPQAKPEVSQPNSINNQDAIATVFLGPNTASEDDQRMEVSGADVARSETTTPAVFSEKRIHRARQRLSRQITTHLQSSEASIQTNSLRPNYEVPAADEPTKAAADQKHKRPKQLLEYGGISTEGAEASIYSMGGH